jgi:ABC-2 type transport system permease protein
MRTVKVFLFEWKHFIRSPFKIVALVLFMVASIYGLHIGADLYSEQSGEIEKVKELVSEERGESLAMYDSGNLVPKKRKWKNLGEPFWAIEYASIYHYKLPSPAMVYSIGQSEQYGYSKEITVRASPYDSDLVEEIANPERLQTGSLDFSFSLLYLAPLLLLVLLYNLKSLECEQGFMPLIEIQSTSKNIWLFSRMMFYVVLVLLSLVLLMVYGASLTNVFSKAGQAFWQMLTFSLAYLAFWSVLFFLILNGSQSIMGSTLKMIGLYLVFAFVVPATIYQVLSIKHPTNLMTDFADAKLDKRWKLWDQSTDIRFNQLAELFPQIENSPLASDSSRIDLLMRQSTSALENQLQIESIRPIEEENLRRNSFIKRTYFFNPITFFHNKFNSISGTHYNDYQDYRNEIQDLVDKQIETAITDTWENKKVDKQRYLEYIEMLSHDE